MPRRRSAARDYLNGRISDEEFQSWVQGLIAARSNKASNNKALSVMEQPNKTPTTMNFPVYPTEVSNISGRRISHFFGEGEAKDNMGSIMGASNVEHQPANTPATSNFPVHPTEVCNVSGRRLSQNNFCDGEEKDAAPVQQRDKVSKLTSDEVSSNPTSPITEPSIIGSSPSRPASVPGYHNQWPGSASITVVMHSSSQPTEQVFGGASTHGQPNTARAAADEHPAQLRLLATTTSGQTAHQSLWDGRHSPSQSRDSAISGGVLASG
jgi:hypothetical protein